MLYVAIAILGEAIVSSSFSLVPYDRSGVQYTGLYRQSGEYKETAVISVCAIRLITIN